MSECRASSSSVCTLQRATFFANLRVTSPPLLSLLSPLLSPSLFAKSPASHCTEWPRMVRIFSVPSRHPSLQLRFLLRPVPAGQLAGTLYVASRAPFWGLKLSYRGNLKVPHSPPKPTNRRQRNRERGPFNATSKRGTCRNRTNHILYCTVPRRATTAPRAPPLVPLVLMPSSGTGGT